MNRSVVIMALCGLVMGLSSCSHYACNAPSGKKCQPLSEIYRTFVRGEQKTVELPASPIVEKASSAVELKINAREPHLSRPRHTRVWLNAWIDVDGDMHEHSYIYLRMDNGHWHRPPLSDKRQDAADKDSTIKPL